MQTDNFYDSFPDRVTEAITLAGGPSVVARKTGITLATLLRWKKGEADPSRSNLLKLAEAAGVSVAWLANGEGEMRASATPPAQSPPQEEAPQPTKEVSGPSIASLLPHGVPDMDMLQALLEGIYRWEERVGVRLQPARKAAMATLLYKYFESEGKVDSEKLDALLSRAA